MTTRTTKLSPKSVQGVKSLVKSSKERTLREHAEAEKSRWVAEVVFPASHAIIGRDEMLAKAKQFNCLNVMELGEGVVAYTFPIRACRTCFATYADARYNVIRIYEVREGAIVVNRFWKVTYIVMGRWTRMQIGKVHEQTIDTTLPLWSHFSTAGKNAPAAIMHDFEQMESNPAHHEWTICRVLSVVPLAYDDSAE